MKLSWYSNVDIDTWCSLCTARTPGCINNLFVQRFWLVDSPSWPGAPSQCFLAARMSFQNSLRGKQEDMFGFSTLFPSFSIFPFPKHICCLCHHLSCHNSLRRRLRTLQVDSIINKTQYFWLHCMTLILMFIVLSDCSRKMKIDCFWTLGAGRTDGQTDISIPWAPVGAKKMFLYNKIPREFTWKSKSLQLN